MLVQEAPPFDEVNRRPLCVPAMTNPRDCGTTRTSSASPPYGPVGCHWADAASGIKAKKIRSEAATASEQDSILVISSSNYQPTKSEFCIDSAQFHYFAQT